MPETLELAAQATARGTRTFYLAGKLFPRPVRDASYAVYWFCRHTDDLVDEAPDPGIARRGLDAWEAELRRALAGNPTDSPILQLFAATAAAYKIPAAYPLDLIAGVRMDLERNRYETFDELKLYCYRVASTVGFMMSHVIGFRDPALEYAQRLGIALQLTNILRDVGEDLERNRIYLPRDELARFGVTEAALRAGTRDQAFRDLMDFQIARARSYYLGADPGIALLDKHGRFAVRLASDLYRHILDKIERNRYDVFRTRAVVSTARKCWLTARVLYAGH